MREEFRVLSPTAILGYGFPLASFEAGLARRPHLIAVDGGSTDPGPYYLGAGVSFTDRGAVKRDLEIMIQGGKAQGIPVIVGSAGGSGADAHLDWCREIVAEIAQERGLTLQVALIRSQLEKPMLQEALNNGKITPLGPAPSLEPDTLNATTNIVAQMGAEPLMEALGIQPDVILAGRAYDPVCFAAMPIKAGYDPALSLHLGKILECAAIASTPGSGSDCMFGTIGDDYFRVEPLNPARKCTTLSVAAHTLYEKSDPYRLPGPGGDLDLTACQFVQETENTVRVSGTKFAPSKHYTVKLEGARPVGYRTVSIAGTRDPIMIRQIDPIVDGVKERVADNFKDADLEYTLHFHIYGKNGVMAGLEPTPTTEGSHELGIIIEATAPNQTQADTICAFARSTMLHYGYEGRRATAGNLAFPYSPSDFQGGAVYEFSLYHLLHDVDPVSLFPVEYVTLGG
ncbi:MAG: DUF1446 domain-containing protein [Oscillospiraceae bacterium]|nr:DUF1446 domain-containing protein [Oscillospiraceae bacterium]